MSITDTVKGVVFGKKQNRVVQPTQIIEHQHHWVQAPPQPKTFSQKIESLSKKTDKFAKKSFHGVGEAKYPGAKFGGSMNSVQLNGDGISIAEAKQWVQEKKEKMFGGKKESKSGDDVIPQHVKNHMEEYERGVEQNKSTYVFQKLTAPKSIPQKMFGTKPQSVTTTSTQPSIIRRAAGAVGTFVQSKGISDAVRKAKSSAPVQGASQWYSQQAQHYKDITPTRKQLKATAKARQQSAPGQFLTLMGGGADPYHKPVGREKVGRKVSKKEAKRLQKLFGENWASKLKKNSKGYYAEPTPADIATARKERKLSSRGLDFGVGFGSMRTGMEVSINREMGDVAGDRESEDPFNIDARFGQASMAAGIIPPRKSRNQYYIKL